MTRAARRFQTTARKLRARRRAAIHADSLGEAGEAHAMLLIMLNSDVPIVFYLPENDIEAIDIIAKRRYTPGIVKLQVKARRPQPPGGQVRVSISDSDLPASEERQILVLEFLDEKKSFGAQLWLIDSALFRELASHSAGYFHAAMSSAPTSRDRWVRFRHPERELAGIVARMAAGAAAGARRRG